ncbi:MAG TPA: 30S ribosomal protein S8 [Candidatus Limnocylindrales bacterium]|nr:30S ribosomal protein S8 [Candidatus Limnocylindrales bacterium]
MSMTDPIADLLTRIRNACHGRRDHVVLPWSRVKEGIARVLREEGYVRDFEVAGEGAQRQLTIYIRYSDNGAPVLTGVRRISRPGLRRYSSSKEAPRVRGGLGVSILSTPLGLLADREARRRGVGGEILCEVW